MGQVIGIIAFIGSVYTSIKQRKAQKRAAAQARQAARDSAAVQIRVNPSGSEVPLLYGRWGTYGITAYVASADNLPFVPTRLDGTAFLGRLAGGGKGLNNRRQYLLAQTILGVAPMVSLKNIFLNDLSVIATHTQSLVRLPDDTKIWGQSTHLFTIGNTDTSVLSQTLLAAQRFTADSSYNGIPGNRSGERTSDSRFRGFSICDNYYHLNLDDPAFNGLPEAFFILEGKATYSISSDGRLSENIVEHGVSNNAVWVLLDYLVGNAHVPGLNYGPKIPFEQIDADSFRSAGAIADEVVLGSGNVDWNKGLPTQVNDNFKTKYDDYSDRIVALGFADINDSGLDTWYRENLNIRRYQYDGEVATNKDYQSAILQILESMPGAVFFRSLHAKWKIVLPDSSRSAETQSVMTITDDFLIGGVRVEYPDSSDKLNGLTGRFSNIQTDFAGDSQYVHIEDGFAEDGDRDLLDTIDLVGCNNPYTAFSRLRTEIMISRRIRFSFEMTARGYVLEPGDVIRLQSDSAGWDKYIRINSVGVNERLNILVNGIEFEPSDYAFITGPKYTPGQQNTSLFSNPAPDLQVEFITYGSQFQFLVAVDPARGANYDTLEFQKKSQDLEDDDSTGSWLFGYLTTSGFWAFVASQDDFPALRQTWIVGREYRTPLATWLGNANNSLPTQWRGRNVKSGIPSEWSAETRIGRIQTTLDADLPVPTISAAEISYAVAGDDPAQNELQITVNAPVTNITEIDHFEAFYEKNRVGTKQDFQGDISKVLAAAMGGLEVDFNEANPGRVGSEYAISLRSAKKNGVVGPYSSEEIVLIEPIDPSINITVVPAMEITGEEAFEEGIKIWRWTVTITRHVDNPSDFRIVWLHTKLVDETLWKRYQPSVEYGAAPGGFNDDNANAIINTGDSSVSFEVDVPRVFGGGAMSFRARLSKYDASPLLPANVSQWGSVNTANQSVLTAPETSIFAVLRHPASGANVNVYYWIDRASSESTMGRYEVEMIWSGTEPASTQNRNNQTLFGEWVLMGGVVNSQSQTICIRMRFVDASGVAITGWTPYTCLTQPLRSTLPSGVPNNLPIAPTARIFITLTQRDSARVRVWAWIDRPTSESSFNRFQIQWRVGDGEWNTNPGSLQIFGAWFGARNLDQVEGQNICLRIRYVDSSLNPLSPWTEASCVVQPAHDTLGANQKPTNDPTT